MDYQRPGKWDHLERKLQKKKLWNKEDLGLFLEGAGHTVTAGTDKVLTNQQTPKPESVSEDMHTGDVFVKLKGEYRELPQLLQR